MATPLRSVPRDGWDALVIGAGPAGCVSAWACLERGLRTLIVERKRTPRAKVCGGCLAPAGVQALERLGLGGALRAAMPVRLEHLRVFARGRSADLAIGPYAGVDRAALDSALLGAARGRGALALDGVEARVEADGGVTLSDGRDRVTLRPGVVVVADGVHGSSVRGRPAMAWRVDRSSPLGVGAVVDDRPAHARPEGVTMVCARWGYVGAAPLGGGRWALAAALDPRAVAALGPRGAIGAILTESGLEPPEALARARLGGVSHLTRRRRRAADGRVLVVGDASGYVQPLTGEGMSWAISQAAEIGAFAAGVARGEDLGAAWDSRVRRVARGRRLLCRAVCSLASRPGLLGAALVIADRAPGAGRVSRRLCWGGA
jgi:menaquinone-9 beta-reductase